MKRRSFFQLLFGGLLAKWLPKPAEPSTWGIAYKQIAPPVTAQANANVVALQLEKVRDKVPLLYERDDILLTMIQQRGDVEKVSSRNIRLPLQVNPGGKAGSYNTKENG